MKKKCVVCGKEFESNHGNRKYCSTTCRVEADEKHYKEKLEERKYRRCRRRHNDCETCEHEDCIYT